MNVDEKKKLMDDPQSREGAILRKLYEKNPEILEKIDYRLLDTRYIDTLGEEKISIIAIRKTAQENILNMDGKTYEIFCKCIDSYLQSAETEDWRPIASKFLGHIETGEYDELIEDIHDVRKVDFDKLNIIMQTPNRYGIKTIDDLDRYEEIVREKCDEIISADGEVEEKKNAVLQKLFGQDLKYAQNMIERFGEDIQNIDEGDEKDFIRSLKAIMDIEDENLLKEIYDKCEDVGLVNGMAVERRVKTAFAQKFNEGLYQPKEQDLIPEEQLDDELKGLSVYDAGTEFKMILTSISSFAYNNKNIPNYQTKWNRPVTDVEHCCTSYIRNDMISTAGIRHFCYGFTEMKPDGLVESHYSDSFTSMTKTKDPALYDFAATGRSFYTPDTQINNSIGYNELDYYFMQGGKKIQPQYIIAFRKNGEIENLEKIAQGAKDWGGKLPIVIVDVDRCLEAERCKLDEMLEKYNSRQTPRQAREILQKIRNNQQTDREFGKDIDNIRQLRERAMQPELNSEEIEQIIEAYKEIADGCPGVAFEICDICKDKRLSERFQNVQKMMTQGEEGAIEEFYSSLEQFKEQVYCLIPDELLEEYHRKVEEAGLAEELLGNRQQEQEQTQHKVGKSDLEANSRQVNAQERQDGINGIKALRQKIQQITQEKEGGEISGK